MGVACGRSVREACMCWVGLCGSEEPLCGCGWECESGTLYYVIFYTHTFNMT